MPVHVTFFALFICLFNIFIDFESACLIHVMAPLICRKEKITFNALAYIIDG